MFKAATIIAKWVAGLLLLSGVFLGGVYFFVPRNPQSRSSARAAFPNLPLAAEFLSPTSSSLLYLVDKIEGAGTYAPSDLVGLDSLGAPGKFIRQPAFGPLQNLMNEMKVAGVPITIVSAYRSYDEQKMLYQFYYHLYGGKADTFSSRPGHSEHQLGLAIDFGIPGSVDNLTGTFGETLQGRWLAAHAWEYGFIQSYPQNEESVTGYIYEPWHYRFVGAASAEQWWKSGLTLHDFLHENTR